MIEKAWVSILSSDRGFLYIEVTRNLYKPVLDHRSGINSGFATKYKCHRLIYFEEYAYMTSAIAREKELKGWRRSKKLALIQHTNERFSDLAEDWGKSLPPFNASPQPSPSRHSDDQREEESER